MYPQGQHITMSIQEALLSEVDKTVVIQTER